MFKQSGEKDVFYITKQGEVLIWLFVIFVFIALSSSTFIFKEKHDENDYQVFLQDVDGLIVGSPVRMMGIEVGHVKKIKPINDEVYVKFVLTNPEVFIPQGTEVTVEFTGLAGSKSLELYLPDKKPDNSVPVLSVNPPKRLHDALALLNNMFKKLGSIIYTTSSFGTKLDDTGLKSLSQESDSIKGFINYSDKFLRDSNDKQEHIMDSIKGVVKNDK